MTSTLSADPDLEGIVADLERLTDRERDVVDAWWRAANYLTVGQIYLEANPLLREPLPPADIKPRLLGHWGTCPGLSFVYAHLNRLIRHTGQEMRLPRRPRPWRPGAGRQRLPRGHATARSTRRCPSDAAGMRRLFRQFSTPGGIPSHVCVHDAGLDPRGRRARLRAGPRVRRGLRQPRPARGLPSSATARPRPARSRARGRASRFLNPARDGAVLPILHLNGYKISGPTVLGRKRPSRGAAAAWRPRLRRARGRPGDDLPGMHARSRRRWRSAWSEIRADPDRARVPATRTAARRAGRLIVLRTPEGLDRARRWSTACRSRARFARTRCRWPACGENPEHLAHARALDALLPARGAVRRRRARSCRAARRWRPPATCGWARRRTPTADCCTRALDLPDLPRLRARRDEPGDAARRIDPPARRAAARHLRAQPRTTFRLFCPDETNSNRLGAVFEVPTAACMERVTARRRPRLAPTAGSWRC